MNERIQELAKQARAEVRAEWDKGNKIPYPEAHYAFQRDNDQKFAELIVRECAKKSKETCNELKADETIQMPALATSMNLYYVTLRNKLNEHFGVEE